jgi:hypothetical protein
VFFVGEGCDLSPPALLQGSSVPYIAYPRKFLYSPVIPTRMADDKHLNDLLEKLQAHDRLFNYNVPARIRTEEGDLHSYLEEVYAQKEFVIREPEEIMKYARSGDKVLKVGMFPGFLAVEKNQWGAVREVNNGTALVVVAKLSGDTSSASTHDDALIKLWTDQKKFSSYNLPVKDLVAFGHFRWIEKNEYSAERPLSQIPANDVRGTYVRYCDETRYRGPQIADGAQGIILGSDNDPGKTAYNVQWENGAGTKHKLREIKSLTGELLGYLPSARVYPYDVHLVIKNDVPFKKLRKECLGEPTAR